MEGSKLGVFAYPRRVAQEACASLAQERLVRFFKPLKPLERPREDAAPLRRNQDYAPVGDSWDAAAPGCLGRHCRHRHAIGYDDCASPFPW